jgi:[ribosomal protein S18]-alanine N-acetyltransferase
MKLRPMTEADLDAVLAAEAELHPFPWTRGHFVDSFKAGHGLWLATEDERMVAYAVTTQVLDETHLLNISVLASGQRQGRGTRVMEQLFAQARERGARRMFLEVRTGNAAALALYRRCGFAQIGCRKGYYPAHAGREDAIVMAKDL